ncbi:MAG: hypothetical protein HC821_01400 [Lewinella sp.]|nr:hypothetical protein [Lewinella sp.]
MRGLCGIASTFTPVQETALRQAGLNIYDGDTLRFANRHHFAFDPKVTSPTLDGDNQALLDTLVRFLNQHPDRHLLLEGSYRPSEAKLGAGFFENLGVARADAVRKTLIAAG